MVLGSSPSPGARRLDCQVGGYFFCMRFKLGYAAGFATGYYLGAKAGHQRYQQINRALRNLRCSDALENVTDTVRSTVKDKVTSVLPKRTHANGSDGSPNGTSTIPAAAPLTGQPTIAPPPTYSSSR